MSQAALDDCISRMAVDPGFHALVRADPTTALAAFDLTEDERLLVLSLAPDHDVHASRLAPRSSKSALFFGTALHDAAAAGHDAASAAAQSSAHAAQAAAGASPVEQAVTWVTAMDHPGGGDPEAQAIGNASNVVQSQGGQAADEAEEEIEEEIQEIEEEIEGELGGQPPGA